MISKTSSSENSNEAEEKPKARVVARIDKDLNNWLNEEFPHGFKQMYIERCLENLRLLIEEGVMPPVSEYSREGTLRTIEKLAH